MKKKLAALFLISMISFCLFDQVKVWASEVSTVVTVNQIYLSKYPDKTVYEYGESFDAAGMEVTGINSDGTTSIITDYTVEGFHSDQPGSQVITIRYQDYRVYLSVLIQPAKVTGVKVSQPGPVSYTLTWDAVTGVSYYEIQRKDNITGTFWQLATTGNNSYEVYDPSGEFYTYQIRAVTLLGGMSYNGNFSEPFDATTTPGMVESVSMVGTKDTSTMISWSPVSGATGYSIYRKNPVTGELIHLGDTVALTYEDTGLKAGTGYQYQVRAYRLNNAFVGELSPVLDISTNPAKVSLKSKAGDGKVRLTWSQVNGATSYEIFMGDEISGYTLIDILTDMTTKSYIVEDLELDEEYTFCMVAKRDYNGIVYEGVPSDLKTVLIEELPATSTQAKIFADQAALKKSTAYTKIDFFKNNVNFKKSYVIPGLVNTNVGGFSSTSMCPQGITFAEDYLLMTSYDMSKEEQSVIYCIDKKTGELLTTLVLPTNAHVGGIAYDGSNIWVTTGTKISALWYSDIEDAALSEEPYVEVSFHSICKVGITASYITYYNDKLWVGSYDELNKTKLYSFYVEDFGSYMELEKVDTMTMPTRVQGIAFTDDGLMILSRSCQLYTGLRGYMRRIDIYQPDLSQEGSGSIDLGSSVKFEYVPSMNEGIAIDGKYLYVLFESAAFENASYRMDRICAFDLKKVLPE